jgi:hypothetical protein
MALTKITKSGLTADVVDETKIADNAISEEHLDTTVFTGNTELSEAAASNDILLVYDASAGSIKKIIASNVGTQAVTLSSVSPTNVLTGDGTGNATFTITGTNLTGASAVLITNSGTEVDFDSVTVDSSTQITAVIAKSSLSNANEPYDVKVYGSNGLTAILRNQINIDASPTFVTASGSLGTQTTGTAGSFSVNATDPESAGNVTFELQSGSLPPGYSITNTAAEGGTAIIAGTDSSTGSTTTFNFVLRAVDAASNTSSRSFSITSSIPVSESFTSSGTFSVPAYVSSLDVLIVAGGGGGGEGGPGPTDAGGGGGGAGGLIFMPGYPVTPGGTVTVTVGCGGGIHPGTSPLDARPTQQGQNSVFGSPGDPGLGQGGILTAQGGGGAGKASGGGGSQGGSGGGSAGGVGPGSNFGNGTQPNQPVNSGAYGFGSDAAPGNGNPGGGGGAGGGAGGAGVGGGYGGGQGGPGRAYTIADGTTPVYYAGGGAGGQGAPGQQTCGIGGQGGGGQGGVGPGDPTPRAATSGQTNTGGGGGGGSFDQGQGAAGGKGVVIVRY